MPAMSGMRRGRRRLLAAAVAATIVAAAVAGPARACPVPSDRYANVVNVGLTIGVSMVRRVKFTYGGDLRIGHGPVMGFARVEGHGMTYARFAAGVKAYDPGTRIQGEVGVAYHSAQQGNGIADALGLHLALGEWSAMLDGQLQGTIPLMGDRENYDLGLGVFFAIPGDWQNLFERCTSA
jgi:hypothetical protein